MLSKALKSSLTDHLQQAVLVIDQKGEVVYSGDRMASYGKMIIIKHAYGFYSIYNQNQELLVSEGDSIEKGQLIALTGDKPFYFEMKKYEEPINPLKYL